MSNSNMKRFFSILTLSLLALSFIGCNKSKNPTVSFHESSYLIPAAGGELIIPVKNSGIDDIIILYPDGSNWKIESNGDMTPIGGWIKIDKVINKYSTRALVSWTSGISITVEPNTTPKERKATITVTSYDASDEVRITQSAAKVQ